MEQRAVHCMILRKNLPKDPSDDRPSRKMTTEEDVRIPTDCERFRACTCLRACQPSSLFALFSSFLVLCSSDTEQSTECARRTREERIVAAVHAKFLPPLLGCCRALATVLIVSGQSRARALARFGHRGPSLGLDRLCFARSTGQVRANEFLIVVLRPTGVSSASNCYFRANRCFLCLRRAVHKPFRAILH
uniref:Transmembrane protein n=1 Tax=Steinernema glaseri TaxID=37863 RepID=A0A1I7YVB1_9BILA